MQNRPAYNISPKQYLNCWHSVHS